jgi:hypothetical protein
MTISERAGITIWSESSDDNEDTPRELGGPEDDASNSCGTSEAISNFAAKSRYSSCTEAEI